MHGIFHFMKSPLLALVRNASQPFYFKSDSSLYFRISDDFTFDNYRLIKFIENCRLRVFGAFGHKKTPQTYKSEAFAKAQKQGFLLVTAGIQLFRAIRCASAIAGAESRYHKAAYFAQIWPLKFNFSRE